MVWGNRGQLALWEIPAGADASRPLRLPLGMGLPAPKLPIMIANRWSDRLEIGHSIWRAVVRGVYEASSAQAIRQVYLEFDRE